MSDQKPPLRIEDIKREIKKENSQSPTAAPTSNDRSAAERERLRLREQDRRRREAVSLF